ncbi:hypothetical protein BJH93_10575 [Kocuria polaris]|nr:hypothetical protein [Kocuria polaris]
MKVMGEDHTESVVDQDFWVRNHGLPEPKSLPVAVSDTGSVFEAGIAHTLLIGATGSGKGSVIWAFIRQLLPAKDRGLATFAGIDPKRSELKGCESLFDTGLAFTPEETAELLERIVAEMRHRQETGGRHFQVSTAMPWLFVVIDEFAGMASSPDRKTNTRINDAFFAIMTQGRSVGIAVLAAAQMPQKEFIGSLRSQFVMRICLRTETSLETSMVLGEGNAELAAAHSLPAATASNNYATAGIGWAIHETEGLVKVRFPYTSDDDIEAILQEASRGIQ